MKVTSAALLIAAGVGIGMVMAKPVPASSSSMTPGSVDDPVVTKSYVDEQIKKALDGKTGNNNGGNSGSNNNGGNSNSAGNTSSDEIEIVQLPVGKVLIADGGAEAVVRTGEAVAYSTTSVGISDLTAGIDITNGKKVAKNHLIWFPRDGRGIQAASGAKTGLTIMVKGKYTIQ
ncbi:hypothetical protein ACFSTH_19520 [Paenibacillus yanchengensis]